MARLWLGLADERVGVQVVALDLGTGRDLSWPIVAESTQMRKFGSLSQ